MKKLDTAMATSAAAIIAAQEADTSPKNLMTSAAVRAVFGGISDMALWRWLHHPEMNFPRPIYIGKRRYWKSDEIEAFQRRVTEQSRAASTAAKAGDAAA